MKGTIFLDCGDCLEAGGFEKDEGEKMIRQ